MLLKQCYNVIWFKKKLHIIYAYIHFIYVFNPNTKYIDLYRIPQISQKNT